MAFKLILAEGLADIRPPGPAPRRRPGKRRPRGIRYAF